MAWGPAAMAERIRRLQERAQQQQTVWNPSWERGDPSIPFDPSNPLWWAQNRIESTPISTLAGQLWQQAGRQGAFGMGPPPELMAAIRRQAMGDYGAMENANRLMATSQRGIDPSTLGFQSLMSQYNTQKGLANQLGQADLSLRQNQLQYLQGLTNPLLGWQTQFETAQTQKQIADKQNKTNWGDVASGLGNLAGGMSKLGV